MSEQLTFERAIQRLEEIVTVLEQGNRSLDESMKLFSEGTELAAFCSETLKVAEQQIVKLTEDKTEA